MPEVHVVMMVFNFVPQLLRGFRGQSRRLKLLVAVVQDTDADAIMHELEMSALPVTKVSSTGGFLHGGSTTLIMGVSEDQFEETKEILRAKGGRREVPLVEAGEGVTVEGGGVLFVLGLDELVRL